jgi:CheY-like chemotaxis protein
MQAAGTLKSRLASAIDIVLACGAKRRAQISPQPLRGYVAAACTADPEFAAAKPIECCLKPALLQYQTLPHPGCHCLLLHGIHAREPANAGLIEFNCSVGAIRCGQCIAGSFELGLYQSAKLFKFFICHHWTPCQSRSIDVGRRRKVQKNRQRSFGGAGVDQRKRILGADAEQGIRTLRAVLGESAELIPADSLNQAVRVLENPVDLIICGIQFDESRMFDLLTHARQEPRVQDIPFLVFRDLESELDPMFFKSLQISVTALGATGFVDLFALKQEYGIREADAKFRRIILDLLGEA